MDKLLLFISMFIFLVGCHDQCPNKNPLLGANAEQFDVNVQEQWNRSKVTAEIKNLSAKSLEGCINLHITVYRLEDSFKVAELDTTIERNWPTKDIFLVSAPWTFYDSATGNLSSHVGYSTSVSLSFPEMCPCKAKKAVSADEVVE